MVVVNVLSAVLPSSQYIVNNPVFPVFLKRSKENYTVTDYLLFFGPTVAIIYAGYSATS